MALIVTPPGAQFVHNDVVESGPICDAAFNIVPGMTVAGFLRLANVIQVHTKVHRKCWSKQATGESSERHRVELDSRRGDFVHQKVEPLFHRPGVHPGLYVGGS